MDELEKTRLKEVLLRELAKSQNPATGVKELPHTQEIEDLIAEILARPEASPYLDRGGRPRVVITGMAAITPLGLSAEETWQGLVAGRSGVDYFTEFDPSSYPVKFGGQVRGFEPKNYIDFKEARRMERVSHFAVAAAQEALADAGLKINGPAEEIGVIMGTALGGLNATRDLYQGLAEHKRLSPFGLISIIPNMPAFHIAQTYGLVGYNATVTTACAAGTQAVGEATEVIRRGQAEVMLAGGTESMDPKYWVPGFAAMHALSTRNDNPQAACRPFDKDRDGFVGAEGCAVLVVESLERAVKRGARIYAEVLGFAATTDGYHMAAPDPEAVGATRAIRWALRNAGIRPEEVDYINAHGASTPLGDAAETVAIKKALGEHAYKVAISSTKSMTGHSFGAAGAIEALATALTIYHGIIHPTINYQTSDPLCDLDYVPNVARQAEVKVAFSENFGLGGQDACIVLGKYPSTAAPRQE